MACRGCSHRLPQDSPGTLLPVAWHLLLSIVLETAFSNAGFGFILLCADSKWHFGHLISQRAEFTESTLPDPWYLCQNTSWSDSTSREFLANEDKERHRTY